MLEANTGEQTADTWLDITRERCPMTYVRVRLALDRLSSGQTLLVHLAGEEPKRNVPQTAQEQGHIILARADDPSGVSRIWIRKG